MRSGPQSPRLVGGGALHCETAVAVAVSDVQTCRAVSARISLARVRRVENPIPRGYCLDALSPLFSAIPATCVPMDPRARRRSPATSARGVWRAPQRGVSTHADPRLVMCVRHIFDGVIGIDDGQFLKIH